MDYNPWFVFWEFRKSLDKRIPSERASQTELNSNSIAPSSEEL